MHLKKRFLSMLLCICIIAMMIPAQAFAADENEYPDSYTIYPTPHNIVYGDNGVILEDVNIVATESTDEPSKTNLQEVLNENGISFTYSEAMVDEKPNIVLGIVDDNSTISEYFDALALEDTSALDELEGYVLSVKDGDIYIMGSESIALYYGVLTLKQMINTSTSVRNILINDFSDNEIRGTVEGYYGIPWSSDARKSILEMMGENKMNMYVYAPKNDPYHFGENWDVPYPDKELGELAEIVETANDNNVEFIYTLHISNEMDLTDEDDAENANLEEITSRQWGFSNGDGDRGVYVPEGQHAIDAYSAEETWNSFIAKFEQMYEIGVRRFGILADDISYPVARYSIPYLINFMNDLQDYFDEKYDDVEPLVFCPSYYHNVDTSINGRTYMKYLRNGYDQKITNGLYDNIELMWTGMSVMSNIDESHNAAAEVYFGKEPLIWWNYPVTDYCTNYVLLGPNPGLFSEATNMAGVLTNPMQQGFASEISIFGVADYTWNMDDYDTNQAWEDSFSYLFTEVADSLYLISQHSTTGYNTYYMDPNNNESEYLRSYLTAFQNAVKSGNKETIATTGADLKSHFDALLYAVDDVRKNCKTEGLIEDLNPWLDKLESLCVTGNAIIAAYTTEDSAEIWSAYTIVNSEIGSWSSITVPNLWGAVTAEIGSEYLKPFINNMLWYLKNYVKSNVGNSDRLTKTNSILTNVAKLNGTPVTVSDKTFSISGLSDVTLDYNYFVGMKIENAYLIDTITVTVDDAAVFGSLELQYSENQVEWTTIEGVVTDSTLTASLDGNVARYVRIINTNTEAVEFDLNSLSITRAEPKYQTVKSATSTAIIYGSNYATNLLDGDLSTPYWAGEYQAPGQDIIIEYDETFELYDYALYASNGDYIRNGSIYVSTNGTDWTQITRIYGNYYAETIDGTEYYVIRANANGMQTKYVKIATEGNANKWTKLFEWEVNQTVDEVTGVKNPFSKVAGGVPENMIDGDIETYFSTGSNEPYLQYSLSEYNGASELVILQGAQNICEATVSIRTSSGWYEIGTLSEAKNSFDLTAYRDILDLKLDWKDNGIVPVIYEIITVSKAADKTLLRDTIWTANGLLRTAVEGTDRYEKLKNAITYAQAVVDNSGATRGMISDALILLEKAMLVFSVDKSALQELVDECNDLKEADYTDVSWLLFTAQLTNAQKVLDNESATQTEVNTAYDQLLEAKSMLVPVTNPVDKELLQLVVDLAQEAINDGEVDKVIDSVKADFDKAFNEAKAVLANENATQEEVDEAYNALSEMLNRLGFIKGDKAALEELYELLLKLDLKDYEAGDAKDAFIAAMEAAEEVLADGDAMQDDVDDVYNALLEAHIGLVRLDRSRLEGEITVSETISENLDKYVEKGKPEFIKALEDAKAVLAKEEVTQAEINAARIALAKARANLRYKANKDILESLLNQLELIDLSLYTDESVEEFNRVKRSAELILDDESLTANDQGIIDDAVKELFKAAEGLQMKPTAEDPDDKDNNAGNSDDTDKSGNSGDSDNSKNSGNPSNSDDSNKSKVAKTGDETYVLVLAMTALCLSLLVIYKRKQVKK